jgi:16S rRNA (cytidine1402-2'-O)-methyltransferase
MSGTLFVVATPIGNLEDLTFRALRTLREVDRVAAEDTRRTLKLLTHYEIRKPLVSLREHNEYRESPRLVARLAAGENVALVSDAGTPGIADPGARLVRAAREAGIMTVPIPGASAVTAALSVAGLDASEFVFMGFAPAKASERTRWLGRVKAEPRLVVFFDAPHRVARTISEIEPILVERHIIILREITKVNFELVERQNISTTWLANLVGEFVVIVGPRPDTADSIAVASAASMLFGYLIENIGIGENEARGAIAEALLLNPSQVERAIRSGRKLAKQQRMTGS